MAGAAIPLPVGAPLQHRRRRRAVLLPPAALRFPPPTLRKALGASAPLRRPILPAPQSEASGGSQSSTSADSSSSASACGGDMRQGCMCCARRGGHGLRLVRWGEVGGWADVVVRVTTLLGLAILYKPLHIFLLLGKLLWWWAAVILLYCVLFM